MRNSLSGIVTFTTVRAFDLDPFPLDPFDLDPFDFDPFVLAPFALAPQVHPGPLALPALLPVVAEVLRGSVFAATGVLGPSPVVASSWSATPWWLFS